MLKHHSSLLAFLPWVFLLSSSPGLSVERSTLNVDIAASPFLAQRIDPSDDGFQGPELDLPEPLPEEETPVLPAPDVEPPDPILEPSGALISVSQIKIIGNTVLEQVDIDEIIRPLEGREVSFQELQSAANSITRLYLASGYITSSAVLAEQEVVDGIVTIQVIEGKLEEIEVNGLRYLESEYVQDRLRLGAQAPLRADRLEEQLRLLRNSDLFDGLQGRLQPGDRPGTTRLSVTVDEATPLILSTEVNNYSSESSGAERTSTTLGFRNVTGLGDRLTVDFDRTFDRGLAQWDIGYQLPVNAMDGTLQLSASISRGEVVNGTQRALAFNIENDSEEYELTFRQPLIRSLQEDFALSFGYSHRNGRTSFNDIRIPERDNRIRAFRFGQDYRRRDTQGAWSLRSQFSLGSGLFDATDITDAPDGQFFSWLGQVQRVQRLNNQHLLIAGLELQLTPDELLGAEQFSIGGGQSIRGYRQSVRSGDNGFRFSVEDRIRVGSNVTLAPFFDAGSVWNTGNLRGLKNENQTFLAGVGLGVIWEVIPDLRVRLDYGYPLIDLDDRGNNIQDDGLYFSVNYRPF